MKRILIKGMAKITQGLRGAKHYVVEANIGQPIAKVTGGIGAAAGSAMDAFGGALDTASGKRMYELMQERMELQGRYNDIVALKLNEALKRIAQLETRLDTQGK